ncbi:MAG: iron uptake porin [Pleurocapsa sp.]
MKQNFWWTWGVSSVFYSGILAQSSPVFSQVVTKDLELGDRTTDSLEQVTNVQQLKDVSPTDWAYEALRSLVDRYGCIAGFPDQTYRGSQPLSRYEFAAGLNSCLNQIERLIASSESVVKQDLDTINRLTREFEAELATLQGRVDNLENRTAFLEDNQFSTTTKLKGQVVFSLNGAFGEDQAVPVGAEPGSAGEVEDEVVFDNRVRLNFDTSFTGKDLLKIRLDALNVERFGVGVTGTNMTRLAFDRPLDNDLSIGRLFYRFRATDNLHFTVDATRGRFDTNVSDVFNSFFANPFKGSISEFGRFNPIYAQGLGGAGVTAVYNLSDVFSANAGYLARNAAIPTEENGLLDGSFAALAQLDIKPTDALKFGLTYVRAYYPGGQAFVAAGIGSRLANAPFGAVDTSADHFSVQTSLDFERVVLSGWAGLTLAHAEADGGNATNGDDAKILNWAVSLAFPDLGGKGNVGGIIVGQQPHVIENDTGSEEDDTNWHLQAQYRYKLTDGISINPGLLAIINPENNSDNDTVYVGTLKTIFEF